jgi:hypothetical protein
MKKGAQTFPHASLASRPVQTGTAGAPDLLARKALSGGGRQPSLPVPAALPADGSSALVSALLQPALLRSRAAAAHQSGQEASGPHCSFEALFHCRNGHPGDSSRCPDS